MSAPSSFLLANETWADIFPHLSLHNLTSVSCVSKTWQALAFPHLYCTVYLTIAEHLKALAERIESDVDGPLSLRTHIRELVFDEYWRKIEIAEAKKHLNNDDLDCLLEVVPKLSLLQHFTWGMPFFPKNMEIIGVLQTANLKSVDWCVWEYRSADTDVFVLMSRPDDFLELLKFKNLTHLALRIKDIFLVDFEEDFIEPIASFIMASPNLESLTLEVCDEDEGEASWDPDLVVGALGDFTFPFLRSFRMLGRTYPAPGLLDDPPSSPLARFFSRHPNLHTIGMGWFNDCITICESPEEFAALFPSLKHLEAPLYMCHPILASSRAKYLESISIIGDSIEGNDTTFAEVMENAQALPNLRKLVINEPGSEQEAIEIAALKVIVKAAPNLEEIETQVTFDKPSQVIELLRLAPNLRVLELAPNHNLMDPDDQEDDWLEQLKTTLGVSSLRECVPALLEVCPLLRCIGTPGSEEPAPYLIIDRGPEGDLRMFGSTTQ